MRLLTQLLPMMQRPLILGGPPRVLSFTQAWAHADSETEAAKLRAKQGELPEPAPPLQEPGPVRSAEQLSLAEARALLDKDHYGLDKVLEHQPSVHFCPICSDHTIFCIIGPDRHAPVSRGCSYLCSSGLSVPTLMLCSADKRAAQRMCHMLPTCVLHVNCCKQST